MNSMQSKTGSPLVRTEAELESRLTSALNIAFPNIPREDLIEQRHFTVRLGHGTYKIDSAAHWKKIRASGCFDLSSGETTCGY
ncbi:hypothetical protein MZ16F86_44690 [Escherichia coli]